MHRRLLHVMRILKLDPNTAFKKCAKIVGDVMGSYHPHGDQSIYDALVRLAQDFSARYPLVDGQGNFGNIDGDNAAAYRYTEARLTRTAIALMAGLDEGTVTYHPTYNGEDEEPEIFPGLFPNLLANGAMGIAVGMATSIPSHNVAEIIDATLLLIDNPHAEHAELMQVFKGPDLATGGVIVDSPAAISAAYESGKGAFRVRGRFHAAEAKDEADREAGIERLGNGMWQLVVSEIPYMVQKGKLIEQIANLIADKKLPILEDIRDESDEQIRLVFVPKNRNVDPDLLKESLYRLSELESRFSLNLNVLDENRTPGVLSLKLLLQEWTKSQIDILLRRSQHRLDKIAARLELVDGYIIAYLNLDRIIEIIRSEDEPKPIMMAEFNLTDRQAEAILNMRLRQLRRLEEFEIKTEARPKGRSTKAIITEYDCGAMDGITLGSLVEGPAHGAWKSNGNAYLLTFELFAFDAFSKSNVIGLTGFFDSGRVWADYSKSAALDGSSIGLKYGVGGGLRWASISCQRRSNARTSPSR